MYVKNTCQANEKTSTIPIKHPIPQPWTKQKENKSWSVLKPLIDNIPFTYCQVLLKFLTKDPLLSRDRWDHKSLKSAQPTVRRWKCDRTIRGNRWKGSIFQFFYFKFNHFSGKLFTFWAWRLVILHLATAGRQLLDVMTMYRSQAMADRVTMLLSPRKPIQVAYKLHPSYRGKKDKKWLGCARKKIVKRYCS
jgi:hypothetical protein